MRVECLIWLYFGEVSLFSIPANLIFTPLISLLMLFTAAYLILYPLYLLILPMAAVLSGFCALLGNLAELLARPDWVMIPVNYRFSVFFLLPMTAMFLLIPFVRRRMKVRLAVSSLLIGVLFFSVMGIIGAADRTYLSFSYLSDRKNDGFVLKSAGRILLCESSDASFGFSALLTDEMAELHACEIDTLLLTHYHNKHVQLVNRLSEREILRNLVLPEPTDERETDIYRSLCENAALHRVSVTTLEPGGTFDFCGVTVTLFERVYLSRSTHPVTAVSLKLSDDRLTMVSSSFNQSVPEITSALEASEYLIFGGHSPVYKKTFGLSFSKKPKAMVVHSDAYSFMDEELKLLADSISTPAPFRLRVRRNG